MKIVLKLLNCSVKMIELCGFNPVQDGRFWDYSRMGESQKGPSPKNLSHISYNDETLHSYTLPKEDPNKI